MVTTPKQSDQLARMRNALQLLPDVADNLRAGGCEALAEAIDHILLAARRHVSAMEIVGSIGPVDVTARLKLRDPEPQG